ncbi:hypothetical protein KSP40_PGU010369 [Platanthera guangdongensis]|uniref:Uncharacterized protein n=1 Tax=Platanthera guangdongensis TaxID=2320717 RepID=A0ABR2MYI5_9ASPA
MPANKRHCRRMPVLPTILLPIPNSAVGHRAPATYPLPSLSVPTNPSSAPSPSSPELDVLLRFPSRFPCRLRHTLRWSPGTPPFSPPDRIVDPSSELPPPATKLIATTFPLPSSHFPSAPAPLSLIPRLHLRSEAYNQPKLATESAKSPKSLKLYRGEYGVVQMPSLTGTHLGTLMSEAQTQEFHVTARGYTEVADTEWLNAGPSTTTILSDTACLGCCSWRWDGEMCKRRRGDGMIDELKKNYDASKLRVNN